MKHRSLSALISSTIMIILFLSANVTARAGTYDPLAVASKTETTTQELVVMDKDRKRDIPLLVYLPATGKPAPVILFSHGLGGSRKGSAYLGKHWAARGYVAVFLQHPGSDETVWKGKRLREIKKVMRKAASVENFLLRIQDVPAVLDQLAVWNSMDKHLLAGKLDMTTIGMSGHSFGAITTQAVSGQEAQGEARYVDRRITAAVIMSPSSPRQGSAKDAFGTISMPWMLMTGTKDISPIGNKNVASRLAVFPAIPKKGKYELVLFDGHHNAFTDGRERRNSKRNPKHHPAILALSTAFWDAYLRKDPAALKWLDGNGPKSVLDAKDAWQKK